MENKILKKLIKEEIKNILKEDTPIEVNKITSFLTGIGKGALSQINKPEELDAVLGAIWAGMNSSMQKNPKAIAVKKLIDTRL